MEPKLRSSPFAQQYINVGRGVLFGVLCWKGFSVEGRILEEWEGSTSIALELKLFGLV